MFPFLLQLLCAAALLLSHDIIPPACVAHLIFDTWPPFVCMLLYLCTVGILYVTSRVFLHIPSGTGLVWLDMI